MYFRDEANLIVAGGRGGNGIVSFHREKYKPKGGPDGGDGGKGGNIIFVADDNINTLYELHRRRRIYAESGKNGGASNRSGKKGKDVEVHVPVGTIVRDANTGQLIKDFTYDGETTVLCKGGIGGRGSQHFATATHQSPTISEDGAPGEMRELQLELRMIADVGLVGFPNAGKSTLLARISAATPKIAGYPFTTLVPQLGIVSLDLTRTMVVADLPGLIEGASDGIGLGHEFLKHVERTRLILHVVDAAEIDATAESIAEKVLAINAELRGFSETLANKPQILVGNKLDGDPEAAERFAEAEALLTGNPDAPNFISRFAISGATGEGVPPLLEETYQRVMRLKLAELNQASADAAARGEKMAGPIIAASGDILHERSRTKGMLKTPPHKKRTGDELGIDREHDD